MAKVYSWCCQSLLNLDAMESNRGDSVQNVWVSGITLDSRLVAAGDLFIAVQGACEHGLLFARQAIEQGALAIACDTEDRQLDSVREYLNSVNLLRPVYWVKDLTKNLGRLASRFFGEPSQRLAVVGVTGTNGKSSCVQYIAALLHGFGMKCGVSGTLGVGLYPNTKMTGMTTPDAISVHRHLAELSDKGITTAVMEVSSHALDQGRVQGVVFDAAVFTNLSHEHQDYHAGMEAYYQAKRLLFSEYCPRVSIINADDSYGRQLIAEAVSHFRPHSRSQSQLFTYTTQDDYAALPQGLHAKIIKSTAAGIHFELDYDDQCLSLCAPVIGAYSVSNLMASVAAAMSQGMAFREIAPLLEKVQSPVGRMERIVSDKGEVGGHAPTIFIDYAHTPDALKQALQSLQRIGQGKLWCVFGCGGERDREKRPQMATIAERYADRVILSSDNPRNEAPDQIIAEIHAGFSTHTKPVIIEDRHEAIVYAVTHAAVNDTVLVAGKGHEDYQLVKGKRLPFDEKRIIALALEERS